MVRGKIKNWLCKQEVVKHIQNSFTNVSGSCFVASWEVIWDKEPGNVHRETIRSFAVNLRKIIV